MVSQVMSWLLQLLSNKNELQDVRKIPMSIDIPYSSLCLEKDQRGWVSTKPVLK